MDNIPGLCCRFHKGHSPKRYLRSRHYFAESCKLKCGPRFRQCILDRTWLYATPILHYVAVCAWFRQRLRKIISTKSSKTTIRQNLDPQKFSAIRYITKTRQLGDGFSPDLSQHHLCNSTSNLLLYMKCRWFSWLRLEVDG